MAKSGADHQFCGDTILILMNEVKRMQTRILEITDVLESLSPAADRIVNAGRLPLPARETGENPDA